MSAERFLGVILKTKLLYHCCVPSGWNSVLRHQNDPVSLHVDVERPRLECIKRVVKTCL